MTLVKLRRLQKNTLDFRVCFYSPTIQCTKKMEKRFVVEGEKKKKQAVGDEKNPKKLQEQKTVNFL